MVNSFIIYKEHNTTCKDSQLTFRQKLVKALVKHLDQSQRPKPGRPQVSDSIERLQSGKHFPAKGTTKRDCVSAVKEVVVVLGT